MKKLNKYINNNNSKIIFLKIYNIKTENNERKRNWYIVHSVFWNAVPSLYFERFEPKPKPNLSKTLELKICLYYLLFLWSLFCSLIYWILQYPFISGASAREAPWVIKFGKLFDYDVTVRPSVRTFRVGVSRNEFLPSPLESFVHYCFKSL